MNFKDFSSTINIGDVVTILPKRGSKINGIVNSFNNSCIELSSIKKGVKTISFINYSNILQIDYSPAAGSSTPPSKSTPPAKPHFLTRIERIALEEQYAHLTHKDDEKLLPPLPAGNNLEWHCEILQDENFNISYNVDKTFMVKWRIKYGVAHELNDKVKGISYITTDGLPCDKNGVPLGTDQNL